MKPALRADLALIVVTAVWGSTFLLVKVALDDVSPLLFLLLRFSAGAVILALLYRRRLSRSGILPGLVSGTFLFAGYAFQTIGLQSTTPSKSAFLTSLSVPMVPLAASLVYWKVPRVFELTGVVIASAGMLLLTFPGSLSDISRGDVLSLFCALSFAGQILAVSYFGRRCNFESLVVMQIAAVALLSAGTFWWMEPPVIRWTPSVLRAVLLTAVLATALAFAVQAWAQQLTTVTRAALIFSLEPVFAWLTSWLFEHETLSKQGFLGAGLILFGILFVEMKRAGQPEHQ